jgi:import receptor subunit TOM70
MPPQSLLTKTQRFIEENQRILLLGCAVAAATGGYYLYSRSPSSNTTSDGKPGSSSSSSSGSKKNKKKKNKKGGMQSGFLKGEGNDGPLLEEIEKPKTAPSAGGEAAVEQAAESSHLSDIPNAAALEAMSEAVGHSGYSGHVDS